MAGENTLSGGKGSMRRFKPSQRHAARFSGNQAPKEGKMTVLNQSANGLPESVGEGEDQYELRTGVLKDLERIK
jgi:hypothetical protein